MAAWGSWAGLRVVRLLRRVIRAAHDEGGTGGQIKFTD
jgi:hypothetical protein